MTDDLLKLAERLWRGEVGPGEYHPVSHLGGMAEICDGVAFVPSFANVSAFATADGLVLVDTRELVRGRVGARRSAAVDGRAAERGWPEPVVLAPEALPARFDRYIPTAGYNEVINQRQFGVPGLRWPVEYRYPDRTYRDQVRLDIGGTAFELRHERGETDGHAVTWVPGSRVLCCEDLFIWASPNAGNPQKVQRYPREWAAALRRMITLEPEYLLPGHGLPIIGAERIGQALTETADLLDSLVDQTLAIMNAGGRLDEAIHGVVPPANLMDRPYLRPVYDEPEFIVHTVWRLYGGWWDGNPASLKPAPERTLAAELAALAGGPRALADRALAMLAEARSTSASERDSDAAATAERADEALRLAGHLAELAWLAAPGDLGIGRVRHEVFSARADTATSTMAAGVSRWAAQESVAEA